MLARCSPVVLAVLSLPVALAQVAPPAILEIDVENRVNYISDASDAARFAIEPNATAPTPLARNFRTTVQLSDIVAINGKPARGSHVASFRTVNLRPAPDAGQAIADITQNFLADESFHIMQADGTPVGTIMLSGFGGGSVPPGNAPGVTSGDGAVVGGTGAFLGVRGQAGVGRAISATRNASVSEDPGYRRRNGGGALRVVFHLIPMARPEIVNTANGPAVLHSSDFSAVTAGRPATAGEVLILTAANLGPTNPAAELGKPFPLTPPYLEVNSPVEVTVNGQAAEVINKIGWPGLENVYRVDFRIPAGTAAGTATVQLTTAWIPAAPVNIPTR